MRLMRLTTATGQQRINPQHVQRIAPAPSRSDSAPVSMLFFATIDPDTELGLVVLGTLDALAAEWRAAMRGEEPS